MPNGLRVEKKNAWIIPLSLHIQLQGQMFMGWLIIETNSEVHTPLLSLPQGEALFGGYWHHASRLCSFHNQHNQSEQLHTYPAAPLYAEKTSLRGMLRKVCCWDSASFPFIWLQQVAPSSFNETPEGKRRCSVTYLAGEEEALAKWRGKTLCTHKSHGGLRGWFWLINRKRTERGKAGEEQLTLERNTTHGDKRGIMKGEAEFPNLLYQRFFFFSISTCSTATTPQPKAPNTKKRRRATGTRQKQQ